MNDPRSASYVPSADSDKDQVTVTHYDVNGRVQWVQDPLGNKTWSVYDNLGRVVKTIGNCTYVSGTPAPEDPTYVGSPDSDKDFITRTVYDGLSRITSTFDEKGNETRYEYDAVGWRTKTITNYVDGMYNGSFPDEDLIETMTYDLAGRVIATIDARGTQTTFAYDAAGRRQKVTQAANTPLAVTAYTCYDKAGQVLRAIDNWIDDPQQPSPDAKDGLGNWLFAPGAHGHYEDENLVTTYTLDRAGRQTAVSDPLGNATALTYFKDSRVESVTDPENIVSQYRYDRVRRRSLVAQGYQANGEDPALWVWSAANSRWQKSDGTAIIHGAANDQNILAQVAYDKAGRMLSVRDPRGNLTTYDYDLLSRRTRRTDPLSHAWVTAYTNPGSGQTRATLTDPNSYQTQRDFDRAGRLSTIQYLSESPKLTPDVTFSYDKAGNRTLMSESTGGPSPVRRTVYSYDKAFRLTSAGFDKNGDGTVDQTVSYQYDAGGLRTRLTLPGNLNIVYTYDARGQLVGLTDWSSQATRYAYDNRGRLISVERPNGLRSAYQYDAADRLRQLRHVAGSRTLGHFAYAVDRRGNRTQALEVVPRAAIGSTLYAATDPAIDYYRGTWATNGSFKVSTNFSASLRLLFFGNQATLTMGTGPDHSIYDVYINGALWQSFDGYAAAQGEQAITIALDGEGPWLLEVRNRSERNLNASAYQVRFKSLLTAASGSLYDARTLSYNYDALSRLAQANYYPGVNTAATPFRQYAYSYDRVGNRTQQVATASGVPTTTNYAYDNANRLQTAQVVGGGTTTYTYDNAGRLINDPFSLVWDRANRLLSTTGTSWEYNGLGQRIKRTSAAVTDYLLDVQPGLWQVIGSTDDGATTYYIHGPNGQHAEQHPAGSWSWPLRDALGSSRAMALNDLTVFGTRDFSPYGEIVGQTGSLLTPFDFTGEIVDPGSRFYLRAREYDAALGMFLSPDPVEGTLDRLMSRNGYSYVESNPTNWTDPSGEFLPLLLGILFAGGLAGAAIGMAVGMVTGAAIGFGSAAAAYGAARAGLCDCDAQKKAESMSLGEFAGLAARNTAVGAGVGGLAGAIAGSGLLGTILVSAFGLKGGVDIYHEAEQNASIYGNNPCNIVKRILGVALAAAGVAGIVGGAVGIVKGIQSARAQPAVADEPGQLQQSEQSRGGRLVGNLIRAIRDDQYTIDRHTINGRQVVKDLARGKEAHVFDQDADLLVLENKVWTEGTAQGNIRSWDRFYYESPSPIGLRIQRGRANIPLYIVEIKGRMINETIWQYHLVPRSRPASGEVGEP